MALEISIRFLAGIFLIMANFFFVVAEFGLTRVRQFSEDEFSDHPGLRRAWKMTEELELHLTGCQLGISSTSVLLGVVFEPGMTALLEPLVSLAGAGPETTITISVVVSIVLINLIHQIWGEQVPTYLGVESPREVLRVTAIPLEWWTRIMYPIIFIGDGVSKWTLGWFGVEIGRSWTDTEPGEPDTDSSTPRTDFNSRLAALLAERGMPEDRRQEVIRSVEIDERRVRAIMLPRDEIVALSTEVSFEENAQRIAQSSHVRYPLVGDDLDDYIGVLYLPTIFANYEALARGELVLDDLDHTDMRVPPDVPVSDLIDRFQDENHEVALVWEDGAVVGLVTLTDAVEAVFGQLEDPLDLSLDPQDEA